MNRFFKIMFGVLIVLMSGAISQGDVHVRGYIRSDGTYVSPHMRSDPDSSRMNNYSTYPNVNPYTGEQGTRRYDYDDQTLKMPSYPDSTQKHGSGIDLYGEGTD